LNHLELENYIVQIIAQESKKMTVLYLRQSIQVLKILEAWIIEAKWRFIYYCPIFIHRRDHFSKSQQDPLLAAVEKG
jgi:hypothetical protein